jgi:hypothetical protein
LHDKNDLKGLLWFDRNELQVSLPAGRRRESPLLHCNIFFLAAQAALWQ